MVHFGLRPFYQKSQNNCLYRFTIKINQKSGFFDKLMIKNVQNELLCNNFDLTYYKMFKNVRNRIFQEDLIFLEEFLKNPKIIGSG